MKTLLFKLMKDDSGASAAEYGLILAIVGVLIGGAALGLGNTVQDSIEGAADDVYNCNQAADSGDDSNCTAYDPAGGGGGDTGTGG